MHGKPKQYMDKNAHQHNCFSKIIQMFLDGSLLGNDKGWKVELTHWTLGEAYNKEVKIGNWS